MFRNFYNEYFKHAVHLKVSGNITQETADFVRNAVKRFRFLNPKAITLSIDCIDGSLVSSEIIIQTLQAKSSELKIPFYTFAQSYALGPSFLLLISSTKSFANPHSIIGGLSSTVTSVGLVKALEKYKVKCTSISTAPIRLDPFQKLTQQDEQWAQNQIKHKHKLMTDFLLQQKNGQAILEKMINGEVFTGSQAFKEGIVAGLENFESVANKEFKEFREIEYKPKKNRLWGMYLFENMNENFTIEDIDKKLSESKVKV